MDIIKPGFITSQTCFGFILHRGPSWRSLLPRRLSGAFSGGFFCSSAVVSVVSALAGWPFFYIFAVLVFLYLFAFVFLSGIPFSLFYSPLALTPIVFLSYFPCFSFFFLPLYPPRFLFHTEPNKQTDITGAFFQREKLTPRSCPKAQSWKINRSSSSLIMRTVSIVILLTN